MPQNPKDSNSRNNKPMPDTGAKDAKRRDKGSADNKSSTSVGSQNHGEKKTAP